MAISRNADVAACMVRKLEAARSSSPPRRRRECVVPLPDRAENNSVMVPAIARVVPLRTVNKRLNEALAAICNVANAVYPPKSCMTERLQYCSEAVWG